MADQSGPGTGVADPLRDPWPASIRTFSGRHDGTARTCLEFVSLAPVICAQHQDAASARGGEGGNRPL